LPASVNLRPRIENTAHWNNASASIRPMTPVTVIQNGG
jgi:hypothetical protein